MTDTDKNINGPVQVEVPIVTVTDPAADLAKTTDQQTEEAARRAFDATHKPIVTDASVSAADGSTTSVAGS